MFSSSKTSLDEKQWAFWQWILIALLSASIHGVVIACLPQHRAVCKGLYCFTGALVFCSAAAGSMVLSQLDRKKIASWVAKQAFLLVNVALGLSTMHRRGRLCPNKRSSSLLQAKVAPLEATRTQGMNPIRLKVLVPMNFCRMNPRKHVENLPISVCCYLETLRSSKQRQLLRH